MGIIMIAERLSKLERRQKLAGISRAETVLPVFIPLAFITPISFANLGTYCAKYNEKNLLLDYNEKRFFNYHFIKSSLVNE